MKNQSVYGVLFLGLCLVFCLAAGLFLGCTTNSGARDISLDSALHGTAAKDTLAELPFTGGDREEAFNRAAAVPSPYTITFNADGGTPAMQTKTATGGTSLGAGNMPPDPTRSGYTFDGWYTDRNGGGPRFSGSIAISGNTTVYAKWTAASPLANLSLEAALSWLSSNAATGGSYTVTLRQDESISPKTLSYNGKKVSITLSGGASERVISLSADGSLFTVGSGITLTLDNNITLQGRENNTASLILVNNGGALVMNTGSKISGNTNAFDMGGGVYVDGGTFTMNGGTISGNSASNGGGVVVRDTGTFIKQSGGVIYGSNANGTLKNATSQGDVYGHAVCVVADSLPGKIRNTTAGAGVTLNSGLNGSAGGWEEPPLLPVGLGGGVPWFVNDAYLNASEDVLIGIGTYKIGADTSRMPAGLTFAQTRARADIARQLQSIMKNMITSYTVTSGLDPKSSLSFQESVARALSRAELRGTRVVTSQTDSNGLLWVVMEYGRPTAAQDYSAAATAAKLTVPAAAAFDALARMENAFDKAAGGGPIPVGE
jgi:uncharacterized repeat protein (TIGR02543 family)